MQIRTTLITILIIAAFLASCAPNQAGRSIATQTNPAIAQAAQPSETASFTPKPSMTYTATPTPIPSNTATRTLTPTTTSTPEPTLVPESAILYSNDFESGRLDTANWEQLGGTVFTIQREEKNYFWHGQLNAGSNYPGVYYKIPKGKLKEFGNYAFESRIRIQRGGLFLVVRRTGGDFYNAMITLGDGGGSGTNFAKYLSGEYQGWHWRDYPLTTNNWYKFRFEVQDYKMSLYIDDVLMNSATVEQNRRGSIGYYIGAGASVDIDDLRIWSLPSKISNQPTPKVSEPSSAGNSCFNFDIEAGVVSAYLTKYHLASIEDITKLNRAAYEVFLSRSLEIDGATSLYIRNPIFIGSARVNLDENQPGQDSNFFDCLYFAYPGLVHPLAVVGGIQLDGRWDQFPVFYKDNLSRTTYNYPKFASAADFECFLAQLENKSATLHINLYYNKPEDFQQEYIGRNAIKQAFGTNESYLMLFTRNRTPVQDLDERGRIADLNVLNEIVHSFHQPGYLANTITLPAALSNLFLPSLPDYPVDTTGGMVLYEDGPAKSVTIGGQNVDLQSKLAAAQGQFGIDVKPKQTNDPEKPYQLEFDLKFDQPVNIDQYDWLLVNLKLANSSVAFDYFSVSTMTEIPVTNYFWNINSVGISAKHNILIDKKSESGWHQLRIPLSQYRDQQTNEVNGFHFAFNIKSKVEVYVDDIQLVKQVPAPSKVCSLFPK